MQSVRQLALASAYPLAFHPSNCRYIVLESHVDDFLLFFALQCHSMVQSVPSPLLQFRLPQTLNHHG